MKKIVLVLVLSFALSAVYSQSGDVAVDFSRFGTPITGASYVSRSIANNLIHEIDRINRSKTPEEISEEILKNIEGTPFMNDQFIAGEVKTADGQIINGVLLRYDVYNNKMEVKVKVSLFELTDELISAISIEGKTFHYLPFQMEKKMSKGYLELIQDGEWNLYCQYRKKFKIAQPQKAMQEKPTPASFKDLPEVYLLKQKGSDEAIGFKNRKELLNVFPQNRDKLQDYLKDQKLKCNNPEDLKKLLTYYESL